MKLQEHNYDFSKRTCKLNSVEGNLHAVAFSTIKPEKPYEVAWQVLERLDFDLGLSCVFVSRTFCSEDLVATQA